MFKGILGPVRAQRQIDRKAELERNLIRHEAKIGGQLFGPVPKGRRREFFCLNQNTWVWHEEWTEAGQKLTRVTRYDIRPDGILKSQDGRHYRKVELEEALNFQKAAHLYTQRIKKEIYNFI